MMSLPFSDAFFGLVFPPECTEKFHAGHCRVSQFVGGAPTQIDSIPSGQSVVSRSQQPQPQRQLVWRNPLKSVTAWRVVKLLVGGDGAIDGHAFPFPFKFGPVLAIATGLAPRTTGAQRGRRWRCGGRVFGDLAQ